MSSDESEEPVVDEVKVTIIPRPMGDEVTTAPPVVLVPEFWSPTAEIPLAIITTSSANPQASRSYFLSISGATGALKLHKRLNSNKIVPEFVKGRSKLADEDEPEPKQKRS